MSVYPPYPPAAATNVIQLDLPGTLQYLNVLGACLVAMLERADDLADPGAVIPQMQLAVHEACANIVQHAYAGRPAGRIVITLTLARDPRRLIVDLWDTGRAFDLAAVPAPNLESGQVRGYGLHLVRSLMDEVRYCASADANRWQLVKAL